MLVTALALLGACTRPRGGTETPVDGAPIAVSVVELSPEQVVDSSEVAARLIQDPQTVHLEVEASVPAADVAYVEIGAPVIVRIGGEDGKPCRGRIVRLGAEIDPKSRTLAVEIVLDSPDGAWRPGMAATLEVRRRVIQAGLWVPLASLEEAGTGFAVFVDEGGVARQRIIETGAVVGNRVQVVGGLAAGDRVVVAGQEGLDDGRPVKIQPRDG